MHSSAVQTSKDDYPDFLLGRGSSRILSVEDGVRTETVHSGSKEGRDGLQALLWKIRHLWGYWDPSKLLAYDTGFQELLYYGAAVEYVIPALSDCRRCDSSTLVAGSVMLTP